MQLFPEYKQPLKSTTQLKMDYYSFDALLIRNKYSCSIHRATSSVGSDKLFQIFPLLFYSQILTPSPYYSTEGMPIILKDSQQEAKQLIV